MKNRNSITLLLALLTLVGSVHAQQEEAAPADAQANTGTPAQTPEPASPQDTTSSLPIVNENADVSNDPGIDPVADQKFSTVLLDNFEVPQGWIASIPLDFGIAKLLYRHGAPAQIASENNTQVLGVKTVFFRRNYGWMSIDRPYPMFLRGFVRNFSVWVQGSNRRFKISLKIRDIEGTHFRLPGGEMTFQGWKKLTFTVTDPVVQSNPAYNTKGVTFTGFQINFDAEDTSTLEPYYLYLDYLTANIDLTFDEGQADEVANDW